MNTTILKQRNRVITLFIYLIFLFIANYISFKRFFPISGAKGLWFYSGLASILLGNLLVTPFFTKPVDSISYSVIGIIALYSVNDFSRWDWVDRSIFLVVISLYLFILLISFSTILLKDSPNKNRLKWANTFKIVTANVGHHNFIFSALIIFAIIVFHRSSSTEMFTITLVWVVIVILKPATFFINLWQKIKNIWMSNEDFSIGGDVIAYQTPGLVLIRQRENQSFSFGDCLLIKDPHTKDKIGIALDFVGRDESLLLRALEFDLEYSEDKRLDATRKVLPSNAVSKIGISEFDGFKENSPEIIKNLYNFVGLVTKDTSIETLYFEVVIERDIEEGRLVEVKIKNKPVLYQIIDGLTKEEIVFQKNTYGYARAKARKIGSWDKTNKKFVPATWLPKINTPVYLKQSEKFIPEKDVIGHFPETNFTVSIKNINHLVNHNTAILGILGIGKSMLAIELVERMIANKIKIICLDLTNQYQNELSDFYDVEFEKEKLSTIQEAGDKDKNIWGEDPESGGSIPNLTKALTEDLYEFLKKDNTHYLKIYNPAQLFATKQLNDPRSFREENGTWKRCASLWTVTPVEITKVITEIVLELLRDEMTDKARACLIFEEAHSLIPEWGSVTSEGDKSATNGTARAILQGRKFGLGCILITQRTANVTKTILNQCNTIFAMRTFDDTAKGFLSNYIGSDYAELLPSIQERHAVFFGKASSCENPVLIRLNDQSEFRDIFRKSKKEKSGKKSTE